MALILATHDPVMISRIQVDGVLGHPDYHIIIMCPGFLSNENNMELVPVASCSNWQLFQPKDFVKRMDDFAQNAIILKCKNGFPYKRKLANYILHIQILECLGFSRAVSMTTLCTRLNMWS